MNKVMKFVIFSFISLLLCTSSIKVVNATSITNTFNGVVLANEETNPYDQSDVDDDQMCEALLGDPNFEGSPAYWIQFAFNIIKYVAIIALLVMVLMDFIQALVKSDKDALKAAATKAVKRFIYCVLIFFLPIIIEFLMELFGAYGTCNIG